MTKNTHKSKKAAPRQKRAHTNKADLAHAVQIVAALLTSGHYTKEFDEQDKDSEDSSGLKRYDAGLDWKKNEWPRRFWTQAVEDALAVMKELKEEINCVP